MFACRPDMRQHMQQLQQQCLELWTRRLSNPGAGRKDYFLAGYLPRRPGGEGGAYEIVRTQRPRAVGVARPRAPTASADVSPAPCRLCAIHLRPQCEQCRQARQGVAHCCAWGHEGHPVAVAGAAASSRVLQAWLAPPEPPPEPPAKRPCMAPAPAAAGRRQRPAHQLGAAGCRAPCPGWGTPHPPPPPTGSSGHPAGGGGTGGEPQWSETHGAGRVASPPPLPPPGAGSPALDGGAEDHAPYERRFFRDIARADGVPGTARLPPTPTAPRGRGGGRRDRHRDGGGTSLCPPFTLPAFAPTGGRRGAAGA